MAQTPENNGMTTEVVNLPEKKRRGRRRKEESQASSPTSENKGTPHWFPVVANLALLVAIFTIIFAAHKGTQKKISTVAPQQVVQETPAPPPVTSHQVPVTESAPAANPQPLDTANCPPPQPQTQPLQVVEEPKKEVLVTNTQQVVKQVKPRVRARARLPFPNDYKNPWNSSGTEDLDADAYRVEYKKGNYITITSSDEPTAPATTSEVAGPVETPPSEVAKPAENTGAEPQK